MDMVYPVLEQNLSQDIWDDIIFIVLLAPEEVEDSPANFEFEHPSPPPVNGRKR